MKNRHRLLPLPHLELAVLRHQAAEVEEEDIN